MCPVKVCRHEPPAAHDVPSLRTFSSRSRCMTLSRFFIWRVRSFFSLEIAFSSFSNSRLRLPLACTEIKAWNFECNSTSYTVQHTATCIEAAETRSTQGEGDPQSSSQSKTCRHTSSELELCAAPAICDFRAAAWSWSFRNKFEYCVCSAQKLLLGGQPTPMSYLGDVKVVH